MLLLLLLSESIYFLQFDMKRKSKERKKYEASQMRTCMRGCMES